jgi:hypothetical protein
VTSRLVFRDIEADALAGLLECTEMICELLSFCVTSKAGLWGYDFPAVNPSIVRYTMSGSIRTFRPPFDLRNGASIRGFLEMCYVNYRTLRGPRRLNIAVDYLNHIALPLAIEVRLTLLSVLLEHLKYTYGLMIGYHHFNRFMRETATPKGAIVTFRRLLTEMLAAQNMTPALSAIKNLRDELIHSGFSALSFDEMWQRHQEISTIVREYLLRLWGYHGDFFPFDLGGTRRIP